MNERIKELMVQVCKEQGLPFTVEHNSAYMLDAFSEKFAKLIVRECAAIADRAEPYKSTDLIFKHFGVEEYSVDEQLRNRSTYFGNDI